MPVDPVSRNITAKCILRQNKIPIRTVTVRVVFPGVSKVTEFTFGLVLHYQIIMLSDRLKKK